MMTFTYDKKRLGGFLAGCRVRKGDESECPTTNTMIPGKTSDGERIYAGKYSITTPEKETRLFKEYCNHVKGGYVVCLTETHKELSPMKFDLDFRFDIPESNESLVRNYTMETIKLMTYLLD